MLVVFGRSRQNEMRFCYFTDSCLAYPVQNNLHLMKLMQNNFAERPAGRCRCRALCSGLGKSFRSDRKGFTADFHLLIPEV